LGILAGPTGRKALTGRRPGPAPATATQAT
jgi:hypothetical protein